MSTDTEARKQLTNVAVIEAAARGELSEAHAYPLSKRFRIERSRLA
jgi:hypothetical protein